MSPIEDTSNSTNGWLGGDTLHRRMHCCFEREPTCALTCVQRSGCAAGNRRSASSSSFCSRTVHPPAAAWSVSPALLAAPPAHPTAADASGATLLSAFRALPLATHVSRSQMAEYCCVQEKRKMNMKKDDSYEGNKFNVLREFDRKKDNYQ